MPKILLLLIFIPIMTYANSYDVADDKRLTKVLIGKWHCDSKSADKTTAMVFAKNGTLQETIKHSQEQHNAYAHQVQTQIATGRWQILGGQLIINDYQINRYSVRMPNAKPDDIDQVQIAAEKSLPVVKAMIDGQIQRIFDIQMMDKRSFLVNDIKNQAFLTCHKKWF